MQVRHPWDGEGKGKKGEGAEGGEGRDGMRQIMHDIYAFRT